MTKGLWRAWRNGALRRSLRSDRSGLYMAAGALAVAACLSSPDGGQAGGSTGVENPEVVMALTRNGEPVSATGTLSLYLSTPAHHDSPLVSLEVSDQNQIVLTRVPFDSAWNDSSTQIDPFGVSFAEIAPGALAKSVDAAPIFRRALEFSVVFSTTESEVLARGFRLVETQGGGFQFLRERMGAWKKPDRQGRLRDTLELTPAVAGTTGDVGLMIPPRRFLFVYLPASPFRAEVDSLGHFTFPRLPQGRHELRAVNHLRANFCTETWLNAGQEFQGAVWVECPRWTPLRHPPGD